MSPTASRDSDKALEWLRFETTNGEFHDVAVHPDLCCAEAIGFVSDDIQREITVERS